MREMTNAMREHVNETRWTRSAEQAPAMLERRP